MMGRMGILLRTHGAWLLLPLILLAAGWLRFTGLNWDEGQHLHPDERFLMMVTASLDTPASVGEYFDTAASPLNPRNRGFDTFVYGTLPTTLLHFVGELSGRGGYGNLLLVGRAISAAADMGTVLLCFLLGWMLVGRVMGGLLAAGLYGFAVLPIQQAHFFTVDSLATFFTASSLVVLVWTQRAPAPWKWIIGGGLWGLALACKLSVYTFFAIPALLAVWQAWEAGRGLRRDGEGRWQALERAAFRTIVFGLAAFVVVRIAMPDAFGASGIAALLPEERWLASITEARRLVTGEVDFPPGHQWTARARYWFPWTNMVLWGMGPFLGIAVWGAMALGLLRLFRGRTPLLLLPVAWSALLFLHQGGQWVMSLRYFLPMYPAIVAVGAWALLRPIPQQRPLWQRRFVHTLPFVVLAGTILWAVAFTSIYRTPHSRVEASRWMLASIPEGTVIGNEAWDDALPLRIDGRDPYGNEYRGIDLHWYAEDTEEKREAALGWLDEVEYIVLSSNRLYDSIPRLWMRYPMTTRYYEALFSGELGFELAAGFTSYPRLGPVEFPDQSAEEAFTVYDHPRVRIYRKASDYTRERAEAILGEADLESVIRLTPLQEARAPNALQFSPDKWERKRRSEARIPVRASAGTASVALRWVVFLFVLQLIAWPLTAWLLRERPETAWCLARPLGLLLLGWMAWLLGSLSIAPFGTGSLLACMGTVGAISGAIAWRQKSFLVQWLKDRLSFVVIAEAAFWSIFVFFLALRWFNPDLWHPQLGGEKPMNMAYLNAVMLTAEFPPHSPWLSGGVMNYYYFGYVLAAVPIHLTGVATEVGYNLSVAMFASLLAISLFAVGTMLAEFAGVRARRISAGCGILTVYTALMAGPLVQWGVIWKRLTEGALRPEAWFWDASRGITHPPEEAGPITEFPYFTFLFGDLHPHLMAMPFFAALIGVCLVLCASNGRHAIRPAVIAALLLGALWVTNSWDLPMGGVLLFLSLLLFVWRRDGSFSGRGILQVAIGWAALLLLARIAFLPFHANFGTGYGAFEFWRGSRTPLIDYLAIYGVFLAVLVAALHVAMQRSIREGMLPHFGWVATGGVVVLIVLFLGSALPAFLLLLTGFCGIVLWRTPPEKALRTIPCGLAVLAIGLGIAVEFFVLRGDISRMNTVFKFYLQAWILFGMTASVLIALFWQRTATAGIPRRWTVRILIAAALASAAAYPLTSTYARLQNRMTIETPRGLDGLAFLEHASFEHDGVPIAMADDLAGIRWLRANAVGLSVIAEATTHPRLYGWGARFATHTGLPAIAGWDWHQRQQYAALPLDIVSPRIEDIKRLYNTPDPEEAYEILRRYGVEYVVLGDLERAVFEAKGIDKFAQGTGLWWEVAYEHGALIIYRLLPEHDR